IDRLTLTPERIKDIARGLRVIAELDDPVRVEMARWSQPNGLDISRVSTPLGVLGVIFESRPNVTVDAAGLAIKSANSVILRGGSDSFHSATMLGQLIQEGLIAADLPPNTVQVIDKVDRAMVGAMLRAQGGIDVIVPRGGRSLVERVQREAKVPVFAHLEGICHIYVDKDADPKKAVPVVVNAKMRRTGICGAAETLLIDKPLLHSLWPEIAAALREAGCEIRGDAEAKSACPWISTATDDDYGHEFLDAIIAVKVVDGVNAAIQHIRTHGSDHTESIITENSKTSDQFIHEIDSSIVMINASTQFADGGEFGMGAELGIATGRIHARGPVSINQLTCFKYIVRGDGQTRP
ncbi:MAG: glutamate-5-semialdehyde dehydrogenase, partial [Candidatus Puniceispirillales bacterium]